MNEQEQFLKDLEHDQTRGVDVLDAPLFPDETKVDEKKEEPGKKEDEDGAAAGVTDEDDDGAEGIKPKNRRERRILRKLEAERESSIFLAGKLEALGEAKKSVDSESDYLKSVERIYGTDTPEAQVATELLKKAIIGARDEAKTQAIAEMKAERQRELEEERQADSQLDTILEDIEDTYNVELNEAQERSFFQLLQKMSPKGRDGTVSEYADPHAVWEVFTERTKARGTDNRAKELSSRSMTRSGASKESTLHDDASTRFLKDNGII